MVSCRRKTTTFNWSSVAFTNMTGVACVARVQWCVYCLTTLVLNRCRLVLSFLPPLSFLWGNNEQHTRGSEIALLFTHAQSHTHTLSFITLAGKKERRETSLTKRTAVCTGEKHCARMIILQPEKCYITMHSFIQFYWWGYVHWVFLYKFTSK